MVLLQHIESLLFISPRPLSVAQLKSILKKEDDTVTEEGIQAALVSLQQRYQEPDRGIQLIESGGEYQMVSHPDAAAIIKQFLKEERTGELTPPSLETLTIVAYRSPISRPHIEQIRGVNCSVILRNLMIRGLVSSDETQGEPLYAVTTEFLQYLGLTSVTELPDYDKLHTVENLDSFLNRTITSAETSAGDAPPTP